MGAASAESASSRGGGHKLQGAAASAAAASSSGRRGGRGRRRAPPTGGGSRGGVGRERKRQNGREGVKVEDSNFGGFFCIYSYHVALYQGVWTKVAQFNKFRVLNFDFASS